MGALQTRKRLPHCRLQLQPDKTCQTVAEGANSVITEMPLLGGAVVDPENLGEEYQQLQDAFLASVAVKSCLVKDGRLACGRAPPMAPFNLGCTVGRLGELFKTPVPRLHPRQIILKPLGAAVLASEAFKAPSVVLVFSRHGELQYAGKCQTKINWDTTSFKYVWSGLSRPLLSRRLSFLGWVTLSFCINRK